MDKNDIHEALNELSGRLIATGRAIGSERDPDALVMLYSSLDNLNEELARVIRVMKNQEK